MWISTVHIVIVYFFVCATTAEIRSKFEHQNYKKIVKRAVGAYSNYENKYNNNYKHNSYNNLNSLKLRHKSRFPNLEKVMTRINSMHLGSEEQNDNSEVHNRLRHNSWHEKKKATTTTTTTMRTDEVFENYFDDDYENDKEDDNWEYEEDNEYEDYEDDGVFSETSGWQAEEPTEKPTTTPAPVQRQMSRISEMKWQMYGTRGKVEENRKKELYSNNPGGETSATLARVHFMRINSEGTCKKPLPRVISVQSEQPDPTKTYTPHCTLLYRCAEDTGCCQTHNLRCGPKKQEEVQLYFYTKTLGTLQSKIEKLTFWNHTECTCIERSKLDNNDENSKKYFKSGAESRNTTPQNIQKCNCPGSFSPKQKYESQCTCNCEETNPDCIRMKNGLEYFSLADRVCVLDRKCGTPICEFGAYLRIKGRCPRKQEKLDAFEHLNIN